MRSILVNADRKPDSDSRVATALELARHMDGHVTVLVDTPVSRYIAMDPMGGSYVISEALDKARGEDDSAAEAIEARLTRGDIPFEVIRSEEDPVPALAGAARLSDLVVVSRSSGIAGQLAMVARAPVLALPEGRTLALPIRRAVIAWDGGEQAASALKAAVPLLQSAQTVKLVTVIEKSGGFPVTDALRYLSRNGLHAEYEEYERRGSTEETLALAVNQNHADLLVMGAYGKSRLREFLFGGVTAHFLSEASAPAVLFSH
ncbi:nucleotide-binding universal stress UspA family protein [Novosphingobium sp. PhB57]|jgi:nucleotide-binding universal stress UspA family protein|uniref:universal stress protein n=1 Tax=unclassified Novosphingobium TaxID=2644732 RepID=UPI001051BF16|nr:MULTISPECIES: universal stress protein [unclassified Novosphingobium]TCU59530.1 nucleotide-binding universal stress UspA family protein [Novosphingobium sp. PhB57]TDW63817.1 nucleotide-binding universal stress UspA family protein [Novosphingobium sp. PhB55]